MWLCLVCLNSRPQFPHWALGVGSEGLGNANAVPQNACSVVRPGARPCPPLSRKGTSKAQNPLFYFLDAACSFHGFADHKLMRKR